MLLQLMFASGLHITVPTLRLPVGVCVCVWVCGLCVYIVRSPKREPTYIVGSNRFVETKMLDLM